MSAPHRKISFPADSVLNSVIQEGDVEELCRILHHERGKLTIDLSNHLGLTAIHHAVLGNNIDAVKLLLSHGASVNVKDIHGFTPLHTAAACGFLQITSLLIVFGADVFSHTKQSELPIDLAKDISVIRLLTEEMCGLLHKELYYTSLLSTKFVDVWIVLQRIYEFLFSTFYTLLRSKATEKTNSTTKKHVIQNGKKHHARTLKKDK